MTVHQLHPGLFDCDEHGWFSDDEYCPDCIAETYTDESVADHLATWNREQWRSQ